MRYCRALATLHAVGMAPQELSSPSLPVPTVATISGARSVVWSLVRWALMLLAPAARDRSSWAARLRTGPGRLNGHVASSACHRGVYVPAAASPLHARSSTRPGSRRVSPRRRSARPVATGAWAQRPSRASESSDERAPGMLLATQTSGRCCLPARGHHPSTQPHSAPAAAKEIAPTTSAHSGHSSRRLRPCVLAIGLLTVWADVQTLSSARPP